MDSKKINAAFKGLRFLPLEVSFEQVEQWVKNHKISAFNNKPSIPWQLKRRFWKDN